MARCQIGNNRVCKLNGHRVMADSRVCYINVIAASGYASGYGSVAARPRGWGSPWYVHYYHYYHKYMSINMFCSLYHYMSIAIAAIARPRGWGSRPLRFRRRRASQSRRSRTPGGPPAVCVYIYIYIYAYIYIYSTYVYIHIPIA